MLDRADVLVADDAAAIDDEAFGHARRTERQLHAAVRVRADPLVGIAIAGKEFGDILGPVADGNRVDLDAAPLELVENRRFADTRHAPAGENVEQAGLAGGK